MSGGMPASCSSSVEEVVGSASAAVLLTIKMPRTAEVPAWPFCNDTYRSPL